MGKLFRRLVCFFLGMIVGVSSMVGGIAGTVYYMYGNVTVEDLANGKVDGLGELNGYSAEDIVGFLQNAISAPESYTLQDIEDKLGVDFVTLINNLAGSEILDEKDKEDGFVDDFKSISLFSILSDDGFNQFLSNVPMGALLAFMPDSVISPAERVKLRRYSLGELLANDEYTGEKGIFKALRDITVGGILPSLFDYDETTQEYKVKENGASILNLIANVKLGSVIDTLVTNKSDIPTEIAEGGLSSIGNSTVGELLGDIISDENVVNKIDSLFNSMKVRDLFVKDAETNKYVFVVENLTDNIKVGGVLGYYQGEDGNWYTDAECTEPVKGVMKVVSALDVTTMYLAIKEEGTVAEKIQKVLLGFGDLTVGDIFETIGYEKNEDDGKWYKDGEPLKNEFISATLDISVADLVGTGELTPLQVVKNLLTSVSDVCGDMTLGESIGDLLGVEKTADGNYVYTDASKGEVNPALQKLLGIKITDLVDQLNSDQISASEIVDVFSNAFSGVRLGDILGFKYVNGKWVDKDGNEVNKYLALVCDLDLASVFELTNFSGSVGDILKALLPNFSIGDLCVALLGFGTQGEGSNKVYYTKADDMSETTALTSGINVLLNLKIWQVVAGFEENNEYDLLDAISDVKVGEIGNFRYDADKQAWYMLKGDGSRYYLTGMAVRVFNYTLGELFDPETPASYFIEDLENITIGDIFSTIFSYKVTEDGAENLNGGKVEPAISILCGYDLSIADIIAIIKGEKKFDIETELHKLFDGIEIGELLQTPLKLINDGEKWTNETANKFTGLTNPIYNIDLGNVVSYVFTLVKGEKLEISQIINDIFKDDTIGDMFVPLLAMETSPDGYVDKNGKLYGDFVDDLFEEKFADFVNGLIASDRLDYIKDTLLGYNVGEYITYFTGYAYEDGKWVNIDGKEIYAPLGKLFSINTGELVDTLTADDISKKDKLDYLLNLFSDLRVGDLIATFIGIDYDESLESWVKDGAKLNSVINTAFSVEIFEVVRAVLDGKDAIISYAEDTFGKICVGDLLSLFLPLNNDEGVWVNTNSGNDTKLLLGNLFDISVNDVLGYVKGISGDKKELIYNIVEDIFKNETILTYVEDFISKEIGNVGVSKLLDLNLTEFTGVILGQVASPAESVTGIDAFDYILDHTSDIKIGDFTGLTYDETEGKWGNDGAYVNDALNTIYNIPVSTVLLGIAGIAFPQKVIEMYGDYRLGYFAVSPFNNLVGSKFTTSMSGDNDSGYVIDGAFKVVGEKIFNFTINDIIDQIKNKEFGTWVKEFSIGDLTYDVLAKFVPESMATFDGGVAEGRIAPVLNPVFPITIQNIIDNIKDKTMMTFLKDTFKDVRLGDLGAIAVSLTYDETTEKWSVGDKAMPLILSDILSYQPVNIIKYLQSETKTAEYFANEIASDIFGERLFNDYTENVNILQKDVFTKLFDVKVVDFTAEMFKETNKEYLKETVGDIYIGDFVSLAFSNLVHLYGDWVNADTGDQYKSVISNVLSISMMDIFGYVDTAKADGWKNVVYTVVGDIFEDNTVLDILTDFVGNIGIDAVEIILDFSPAEYVGVVLGVVEKEFDSVTGIKAVDYIIDIAKAIRVGDAIPAVEEKGGTWYSNNVEQKVLLCNVYDISVGSVVGYVDTLKADGWKKAVYEVVDDVFGAETVHYYIADFTGYQTGIPAVDNLLKFSPTEYVGVVLGVVEKEFDSVVGIKAIDYFIDLATATQIGEFIPNNTEEDDVWYNNGRSYKKLISNVFNISVNDIIGYVKDIKDAGWKTVVYNVVYDVLQNEPISTYTEDFTGKRPTNDGLNKLLGFNVTEFTGLLLGQGSVVVEEVTGVEVFDYMLDFTSDIKIGDFVGGVAYDEAEGKWMKGDSEVTGILGTVYNVSCDMVLLGIAAIIFPDKAMDMYGDYRLGYFAYGAYNNVLGSAFTTSMSGNNEVGYTIEGAFKVVGETYLNITIREVYDKIKSGEIVSYLKDKTFALSIRDLTYDVLGKVIKSESIFLCDGVASDNKPASGKLAVVFNPLFPITIQQIVDGIKDKTILTLLKDSYENVMIGEIVNIAVATEYDGSEWTVGGKTALALLGDIFSLKLQNVFKYIDDRNEGVEYVVKEAVADICGEKTFNDYTQNISLLQKEVFVKVLDEKMVDFTAEMFKADTRVEYIKSMFNDVYVGDFLSLAFKIEHSYSSWVNPDTGNEYKALISNIFDITVLQIFGYIDTAKTDGWQTTVYEVVDDISQGATVLDYVEELSGVAMPVSALEVLLGFEVAEYVGVVLGVVEKEFDSVTGIKAVDYIIDIAKAIRVGDAIPAVEEKDGTWYSNNVEQKVLLCNVYDISVGSVVGYVDTLKADGWKKAVYNVVYDVLQNEPISTYTEDFTGMRPANNGANKLLGFNVTEFTGLLLGQGSVVVEEVTGITVFDYLLDFTSDIKIGDFVEAVAYDKVEDKWMKGDSEVTGILATVYNVPCNMVLLGIAAIIFPDKAMDMYGDYYIASFVKTAYNNALSEKFDSTMTGDDAKQPYVVVGKFKKVAETALNVTVRELYDTIKGGTIKTWVKDKFFTLKVGDYTYDLVAKFVPAMFGLKLEGYAYENVDATGNYVANANFKVLLDTTFNITLTEIYDTIKGKLPAIKTFVVDNYMQLKVGDYTFDLFRKFVAPKLNITATGYAYEGYQVSGKMNKFFKATFNANVYNVYRSIKSKQYYELLKELYGTLTVGDVAGKVVESVATKLLKTTFTYDTDYNNIQASGNYAEVVNTGLAISIGDLVDSIKNKTILSFAKSKFGDTKLGDILGYLLNKTLSSKCTITHEYASAWVISGAYSKPLTIAFNDITLREVYDNRSNLKQAILIDKFGTVMVGELLGGYYETGAWHKSNGDVVDASGINAIMVKAYNITLAEILADGFDIGTIFNDVYVGELMGYNGTVGAWTTGNPATAVTGAEAVFADIKLGEVLDGSFNINDKIQDLKLSEVMTIDSTSAMIFQLLADTQVKNLSTEVNALKLGDIMGFTYNTTASEWQNGDGTSASNFVQIIGNYTVAQFSQSSFTDTLLSDIKTNLTVEDVFGTIAPTSPLSLIPATTTLDNIATAFATATKNANLAKLIEVGVMDDSMFASDSPLGLLKSGIDADSNGKDDGLEATTLANIQNAIKTRITTAKVGELITTGVLPLTATQQTALDAKLGTDWRTTLTLEQFFDAILAPPAP